MSNDIRGDTRQWDTFIGWARRFFDWDDFDDYDVDGTRQAIGHLLTLQHALNEGEQDWLTWLHHAFEPRVNGLGGKTKHDFADWCKSHPGEAREALLHLWDVRADASVSDRVDRFTNEVGWATIGDAPQGASLASCMLMALDFSTYPVYGADVYESAYHLTGFADQPAHGPGAIYQHALDFLDRLLLEARNRDLLMSDRQDAQRVLWAVVARPGRNLPASDWPVEDRERLVVYRHSDGRAEAAADEGASTHSGQPGR